MNQQIANNIENILDAIGIDYYENNGQYRFSCPIHGGNHKNACIYITDGYEPNWKCYSKNCHEGNASLVAFLMKTLNISYHDLKDWLKKFNIKEETYSSSRKFVKSAAILTKKREVSNFKISLTELKKFRDNPSFYINRGFKPSTLDNFKVKYCANRKDPFFSYVIVPVFNDDGKSIAGLIGRSTNPQCPICEKYHKPNDPCSKNGMKWKNTKGFKNNAFFYNLWNAKEYIKENNEVILVESAADVWRMYEAGIYNVLGMFGTSLSVNQKIILESLPILKIVLFLDPDEAGKQATIRLGKYLERFYTVEIINNEKQPADCQPEELRKILWK